MHLNWDAINTIAEIIGAMAVAVTLVFLVVEIRRNTRETSRRIALERTSRAFEPFLTVGGMSDIHAKIKAIDGVERPTRAFMDAYGLSTQEAIRWVAHLALNWSAIESDFIYLGPSQELVRQIRTLLDFADDQLFWSVFKETFRADFSAYVDGLIGHAGQ